MVGEIALQAFVLTIAVGVVLMGIIIALWLFYEAWALRVFGGAYIKSCGLPSLKELWTEWRRRR